MAAPVQKAVTRLLSGLAAGDPYEAQQGVKTTYYRLKARRQTRDGYDLLQQAAVVQFGAGQFTCGVELAKLLLEAYRDDAVSATQEAVDGLYAIMAALPAPSAGDAASRDAMVESASAWAESAIAWAARNGVDSRQLQLLHCAAADWQWGMRDGSTAVAWVSRHYAAACNAEALFHVLSDGLDPAKAREWDLYVCRAFLLVLASSPPRPQAANIGTAQAAAAAQAAAEAQAEHSRCAGVLLQRCDAETTEPEFSGIPGFPLISFCRQLLQLLPPQPLIPVQKGARVLGALRQHYQPALQQDPELGQLLDTAAGTYFGVRANVGGGMGGMMGGLLQMLGGGGGGGSQLQVAA